MSSTRERSRARRLLSIFLFVLCLLRADVTVAGQAPEATIIGQVTDESGAVLPGVTVTATSPVL
jgi:hypothetical protein